MCYFSRKNIIKMKISWLSKTMKSTLLVCPAKWNCNSSFPTIYWHLTKLLRHKKKKYKYKNPKNKKNTFFFEKKRINYLSFCRPTFILDGKIMKKRWKRKLQLKPSGNFGNLMHTDKDSRNSVKKGGKKSWDLLSRRLSYANEFEIGSE